MPTLPLQLKITTWYIQRGWRWETGSKDSLALGISFPFSALSRWKCWNLTHKHMGSAEQYGVWEGNAFPVQPWWFPEHVRMLTLAFLIKGIYCYESAWTHVLGFQTQKKPQKQNVMRKSDLLKASESYRTKTKICFLLHLSTWLISKDIHK